MLRRHFEDQKGREDDDGASTTALLGTRVHAPPQRWFPTGTSLLLLCNTLVLAFILAGVAVTAWYAYDTVSLLRTMPLRLLLEKEMDPSVFR
jgi:hypothetical protein